MSRRWRLVALLLLLPLLSGCFGGGGTPIPEGELGQLREQLEELDRLSGEELDSRLTGLQQEVARAAESKDRALREEAGRKRLLAGYCWERRGDFVDAERNYQEASGGSYGAMALFRLAQVAGFRRASAVRDGQDPSLEFQRRQEADQIAKEQREVAVRALNRGAMYAPGSKVLVREPPVASLTPARWERADLRHESSRRLDEYNRGKSTYRALGFLVRLCGGGSEAGGEGKKSYPYLLAILLIAVLAKLVTTPLSAAQFRSMRALQAVQPELKKLQEKYKGDKAGAARAQMELFREHKVNPASSCLPMLIQFPILIWVYYAIRDYVFQFTGVGFLYLTSLADPDVVGIGGMQWPGPVLIVYGFSMYFSQKLLAQPSATPEQQQQQKMLSYMMPVLLLLLLKSLPAAFILYWLLQNVLMTGHQYLIMRSQRPAAEGAGGPRGAGAGPPPQAIQKLAQGSGSGKPKKKRR